MLIKPEVSRYARFIFHLSAHFKTPDRNEMKLKMTEASSSCGQGDVQVISGLPGEIHATLYSSRCLTARVSPGAAR